MYSNVAPLQSFGEVHVEYRVWTVCMFDVEWISQPESVTEREAATVSVTIESAGYTEALEGATCSSRDIYGVDGRGKGGESGFTCDTRRKIHYLKTPTRSLGGVNREEVEISSVEKSESVSCGGIHDEGLLQ